MCVSLFSSRFSPCTVVLLTPLCRSGVACRMGQSEEERGQGQAGERILVDEPHNVSGVPRSRVCGSCDHYFALPVVPYRLLHPFTGQGPEGQATCAACGAGRSQQEGWLLEIQKGVLCVLRVLSVPFSVASGSASGCVLCLLRVLGALRASSGIASGVASMCLACSVCSTDSARPAVDVDPR